MKRGRQTDRQTKPSTCRQIQVQLHIQLAPGWLGSWPAGSWLAGLLAGWTPGWLDSWLSLDVMTPCHNLIRGCPLAKSTALRDTTATEKAKTINRATGPATGPAPRPWKQQDDLDDTLEGGGRALVSAQAADRITESDRMGWQFANPSPYRSRRRSNSS